MLKFLHLHLQLLFSTSVISYNGQFIMFKTIDEEGEGGGGGEAMKSVRIHVLEGDVSLDCMTSLWRCVSLQQQ